MEKFFKSLNHHHKIDRRGRKRGGGGEVGGGAYVENKAKKSQIALTLPSRKVCSR